jgi:hypothetical protein
MPAGERYHVVDGSGRTVAQGATKEQALAQAWERRAIGVDEYQGLKLNLELNLSPILKNPGLHLRSLGTDALGKGYPGKTIAGAPTHAHHIVMQEGVGAAGKDAVQQAQAILTKYGIDPFKARENLVWAPKIGYLQSEKYALQVLEKLKAAEQTKEGITEALRKIADIVSRGDTLK